MSSQIKVGDTIPAVKVKELAADKAEPLVLKGKNVIVRGVLLLYHLHLLIDRMGMLRSVCQAPSLLPVTHRYQATSTCTMSSRKRA